MRPLILVVSVGLISCGSPAVPPELITRSTNGVGPVRTTEGTAVDLNDQPDASVDFYDAGSCCMVPVAIAVQGDETVGYATAFPSGERVPLTKNDGVWSGQMCFWLSEPQSFYYFQLGYSLNDEDAGLLDAGEFVINSVNRAVPTEGVAAVGEVNVFTRGEAMACTEVDAGVYGQVFDAGGGADGG